MRKLCLVMCLLSIVLCLCSCDDKDIVFPYVEYCDSKWTFDIDNKMISMREGYVLDQSHSYDVAETEYGYSIIMYFVKEGAE